MPPNFSLSYLLYILIGSGCIWLATKVIRERLVGSPKYKSLIAMAPLVFPVLVLVWSRPDLSNIVVRTEGVLPVLSGFISNSLGFFMDFNPLIIFSYLRLEIRILEIVAELSGAFLLCGILIATTILLVSRFLGNGIIKKIQGTIEIDDGEIPELESLVSTLSKKAGISTPKILITEDLRPDAFTMGQGPSASLVFSIGLLANANPDEMEAVVAHEIAHLKNRDGLLKLLVGWLRLFSFYNPIAHMSAGEVERERELLADQTAVDILGDPGKLIMSLDIAKGGVIGPRRDRFIATFSGIFSTSAFTNHHPTPEQRSASATMGPKKRKGRYGPVWFSIAVLLLLASAYLPAEAARVMHSHVFLMPLWVGRPEHADISGKIASWEGKRDFSTGQALDMEFFKQEQLPVLSAHHSSIHAPLEAPPDPDIFPGMIGNPSEPLKPSFKPPESHKPKWFSTVIIATNILRNIY